MPAALEPMELSQKDGVASGMLDNGQDSRNGPRIPRPYPANHDRHTSDKTGIPWIWILVGSLILLLLSALIGSVIFFLSERDSMRKKLSAVKTQHLPSNCSVSCAKEIANMEAKNPFSKRKDRLEDLFPFYEPRKLEDLILPRSLAPEQYWITIQPFLEITNASNLTFLGNVTILLRCLESTSQIQIHARKLYNIKPYSITVVNTNDSSEDITVTNVTEVPVDKLKIDLSVPLRVGNFYQLDIINYIGLILRHGKGFYLSSYRTPLDDETRYLAVTQFEVANARMAFPCFDEPRFKANFTMIIKRRNAFKSLSNMEREKSRVIDSEWQADYYKTSVKMSSYLVAWSISDFHYKEDRTRTGIRVRAWARPNAMEEVNYALDMAVKILDYFSDYFAIPYSLNKCDLIALPDFSHGAMENWGLITFRETTMLYNPKRDNLDRKQNVAVIVGHEVAHQWFGNIVTMEWWTDLWLNEGFAHFMAYVSAGAVDNKKTMEDAYIYENVLLALKLDSLNSTHPVVTEVYDPDEILQLFDIITYRKGSCLIRMMRDFLTEETFRSGMQVYLNNHAFDNAVSNDLWTALDKAVDQRAGMKSRMEGLKVGKVMNNWVNQPGYPYVRVIRDYVGQTIELSQQKFVIDPVARNDSTQQWIIPFTYITSDSGSSIWRNPGLKWIPQNKSVTLPFYLKDTEWIIGNIKYSGFYRVNYDQHNWHLLMDQLSMKHLVFPTTSRAQILDDSFELSRAGLLDPITALNATRYLHSETEYLPWAVALSNFRSLDDLLQNIPTYEMFLDYMKKLLEPTYFRLGWNETDGEGRHLRTLRQHIISHSCYYSVPHCLDTSREIYSNAMADDSLDNIPPTLRATIICTAIREGGSKEWKFAWKHYVRSLSSSDKKNLLQTLGCTRIPWILNSLFFKAMDSKLVRQWDIPDIVVGLNQNPAGRSIAWNFMKQHWEEILEKIEEIAGKLVDVILVFNTPYELEDVEDFMKTRNLATTQRKFVEAHEAIAMNIEWKQKNAGRVEKWLEKILKGSYPLL